MQVSTIGLDLAKNVFQVHGIDANEKVVVRKQLRRSQVIAFFEALPPCLVGMEACATAHHWARELRKLGHEVRLMPAKDVKAYVKRNKNDAADAEAICEAVRRPTMRFVTVKTVEQQGRLMQHRVRDQLMRQRTQLINALRSHMAELGIAAAQGREGLKELLAIVAAENDADCRWMPRRALMVLAAQLQACQTLIGMLEKRIMAQHKSSDRSRRLETIPGIGVIGATTIAAPLSPTPRPSDRGATLRRGSVWCRDKIQLAASRGLGASPSKGTATCGASWSLVHTPSCGVLGSTRRSIPGSRPCWHGDRSRLWQWHWPTRWRASLGPCWPGVGPIERRSSRQQSKWAWRWGG